MTIWKRGFDLVFPVKCPFCRGILEDSGDILCPDCQKTLPWLLGREAERKVDFSAGCLSPLGYRDQVPGTVHRYKFAGLRSYGVPFGTLLTQCARDHLTTLPDAVTWAPLSRRRLRERGYDQAQLLAQRVGEGLSLPLLPTLVKCRDTGPQSDLQESAARRANALNAYELLPGADVKGKCLLLVDDVVTSGATLGECARVLTMAGAKEVRCLTLAQARESGGS